MLVESKIHITRISLTVYVIKLFNLDGTPAKIPLGTKNMRYSTFWVLISMK